MNGFDIIIKPDEQDEEAAELFVDGKVGGRPYRFLLDTGAARTSLNFDEYTAAFDSIGKKESSGVFALSSDDLITVPLMELGPISKTDFTVARAAKNHPVHNNLIGMDLLKAYGCHFLFDQNKVLLDPVEKPGEPVQDLILDSKFHPYIPVQFGSQTASAVWDTGAGITVMDTTFLQQHPAYFQQVGQSGGTDATGATMQTPMFLMASVTIGGRVFPPHTVAGVDLSHVNTSAEIPMDMILGYSTLRKANWWFDFPRKRWAVSKMIAVQ